MRLLAMITAAVLGSVSPVSAVPVPTIPPATIDNNLEVVGENLSAEERRTRLFVDVMVNGKGPYSFLVDSGADRSVIGAGLAERLDLPVEANVMVRGMAGTSPATTVLINTLSIGSTSLLKSNNS